MAQADWLVKLRISCAIYLGLSNSRENGVQNGVRKWRPKYWNRCWNLWIKIIFYGVYDLTVLVYTKTTIHLSVGD